MKTLFCLFMIGITVRSAQAQDSLAAGVFGSGGLAMTDSTQYVLIGTLGQTAIGSSLDASTALHSGFWYSVGAIVTDIKPADEALPKAFMLYPNYPNPFNPSTTIRFDLPAPNTVRLVIYNILGQEVKTLVHQRMNAGHHRVVWNGTNRSGARVATGVYVYRIVYGNKIKSKKMMVLK